MTPPSPTTPGKPANPGPADQTIVERAKAAARQRALNLGDELAAARADLEECKTAEEDLARLLLEGDQYADEIRRVRRECDEIRARIAELTAEAGA